MSVRSGARSSALKESVARGVRKFNRPTRSDGSFVPVSEYFGCNTFTQDLLARRLSEAEMHLLKDSCTSDTKLTIEVANKVAEAVKEWALARGATHYCHWFQPQTGLTAEKHDSFLWFDKQGKAIELFNGKLLIQSEPDASSFPSGGRRSTFEARGYTAWDASSPMFLMEAANGLTLCIPSLFISYSGEALDKKTPLLRSIRSVSDAAAESLKLLGAGEVDYVLSTCGPEQEYFVVDRSFYALRPDLQLAGRTLIGRVPPKGQQLEDHYFGSINSRVLSFMTECEYELYKLGVPIKTRHNEVAPSQCETAPIFEFANVAADHNQLVMEVLRNVARRHDLVVLFHEKPYAEINGSGKHLNWSLADSQGRNLLDPGDKPNENLRFLYFLTAAIKAVNDWGDLLRVSVATAGNDHRLGANEAPPAIMSVFLGETLTEVLEKLEGRGTVSEKQREINLDLARVPVIARDNTDRNRTSPFAFTGNKFEFRAVGSSQSISGPTTHLNAAVAQALSEMNKSLKAASGGGVASPEQILKVVAETYHATKRVCFEGNGYSAEWHKEAERRGLPNLKDTPAALKVLSDARIKKLFTEQGIYNNADELDSRHNVAIERYIKIRRIELETLHEMVSVSVIPAANAHLARLGEVLHRSKEIVGTMPAHQVKSFENTSQLTESLVRETERLGALCAKVSAMEDHEAAAALIAADGLKTMDKIRELSNELELVVDDDLWSLPKFREMIFNI